MLFTPMLSLVPLILAIPLSPLFSTDPFLIFPHDVPLFPLLLSGFDQDVWPEIWNSPQKSEEFIIWYTTEGSDYTFPRIHQLQIVKQGGIGDP